MGQAASQELTQVDIEELQEAAGGRLTQADIESLFTRFKALDRAGKASCRSSCDPPPPGASLFTLARACPFTRPPRRSRSAGASLTRSLSCAVAPLPPARVHPPTYTSNPCCLGLSA